MCILFAQTAGVHAVGYGSLSSPTPRRRESQRLRDSACSVSKVLVLQSMIHGCFQVPSLRRWRDIQYFPPPVAVFFFFSLRVFNVEFHQRSSSKTHGVQPRLCGTAHIFRPRLSRSRFSLQPFERMRHWEISEFVWPRHCCILHTCYQYTCMKQEDFPTWYFSHFNHCRAQHGWNWPTEKKRHGSVSDTKFVD